MLFGSQPTERPVNSASFKNGLTVSEVSLSLFLPSSFFLQLRSKYLRVDGGGGRTARAPRGRLAAWKIKASTAPTPRSMIEDLQLKIAWSGHPALTRLIMAFVHSPVTYGGQAVCVALILIIGVGGIL